MKTSFWLIFVAVGGVALSCGGTTSDGDSSGKKPLEDCSLGCGGDLECIEGRCTETCDHDDDCRSVSKNARCITGSSGSQGSSVSSCDVGCGSDTECASLGKDYSCVGGRCRFTEPEPDPPPQGCNYNCCGGEGPPPGCPELDCRCAPPPDDCNYDCCTEKAPPGCPAVMCDCAPPPDDCSYDCCSEPVPHGCAPIPCACPAPVPDGGAKDPQCTACGIECFIDPCPGLPCGAASMPGWCDENGACASERPGCASPDAGSDHCTEGAKTYRAFVEKRIADLDALACDEDADCTSISPMNECEGSCGMVVNETQTVQLSSDLAAQAANLCAGCTTPDIGCPAIYQTPVCKAGACAFGI